ncbi:hypothetical protein B0H34DRAFT_808520 [Crassisporium funariophilum]|nr:hypothetical protein B0H34DRAFT_808520 [Crassisporium funariophilum]
MEPFLASIDTRMVSGCKFARRREMVSRPPKENVSTAAPDSGNMNDARWLGFGFGGMLVGVVNVEIGVEVLLRSFEVPRKLGVICVVILQPFVGDTWSKTVRKSFFNCAIRFEEGFGHRTLTAEGEYSVDDDEDMDLGFLGKEPANTVTTQAVQAPTSNPTPDTPAEPVKPRITRRRIIYPPDSRKSSRLAEQNTETPKELPTEPTPVIDDTINILEDSDRRLTSLQGEGSLRKYNGGELELVEC